MNYECLSVPLILKARKPYYIEEIDLLIRGLPVDLCIKCGNWFLTNRTDDRIAAAIATDNRSKALESKTLGL